jgi:hypothetical protein
MVNWILLQVLTLNLVRLPLPVNGSYYYFPNLNYGWNRSTRQIPHIGLQME